MSRACVPHDTRGVPDPAGRADAADAHRRSDRDRRHRPVVPPIVTQTPVAKSDPVVPPVTIPAPPPVAERYPGLVIPAADHVGAAMFRRGGVTYVVIDAAVSFAPPADSMFSDFSAHLLPDATVLRIVPKDGRGIALTRAPERMAHRGRGASGTVPSDRNDHGWQPDHLRRAGTGSDRFDPRSRQRRATADRHAARPRLRHRRGAWTVDFVLPATALGIMVEALSDRVTLRATQTGFVLSTPGAGAR